MISSASTAPARCSAFSPARPPRSAGRCVCACNCAASTRSAGWLNATWASASCRRRRRAASRGPWRSRGRAHRCVGGARADDLHSQLRRIAALCPPARRAPAQPGVNFKNNDQSIFRPMDLTKGVQRAMSSSMRRRNVSGVDSRSARSRPRSAFADTPDHQWRYGMPARSAR